MLQLTIQGFTIDDAGRLVLYSGFNNGKAILTTEDVADMEEVPIGITRNISTAVRRLCVLCRPDAQLFKTHSRHIVEFINKYSERKPKMIVKYVARAGYGERNLGIFDNIKDADWAACEHIIESKPIAYRRYLNDMQVFNAQFEEEHNYLQQNNKGLVCMQFEEPSVFVDEIGFDDAGNLIMVYGQELNEYIADNFDAEDVAETRHKLIAYLSGAS